MSQKEKLRISFFGLGYVGLTNAACFAFKGFNVLGYDIEDKRVEKVKMLENYTCMSLG
ncbi:MAG: hypothetical protein ACUVTD_03475 [Nitrososphaerales archaeon]